MCSVRNVTHVSGRSPIKMRFSEVRLSHRLRRATSCYAGHLGQILKIPLFTLIVTCQWCMYMYVKRTNIYLREDPLRRLKAISEQTGAPVSALIRKAIEEYLKKR